MPDLEDDNDDPRSPQASSRSGPRGRRGGGTSVTWRGIVDEPSPDDPPKHPRLAAMGRGTDRVLVGTGLKRGRDDDGTLLPRRTSRLVGILATLFVVVVGYS